MAYGDVVGTLSLLVTIIGFWIAIAQLGRTTTATNAVKASIDESSKRMRVNHLLVLLPQFRSWETDLDAAEDDDDRKAARRALVGYSHAAYQVAGLLVADKHVDSNFIQTITESANMASTAKGKLASGVEGTVRDITADASTAIAQVTSKCSALVTTYQTQAG